MTTLEEKFEKVITIMTRVAALRMWESAEKAGLAHHDPGFRDAAKLCLEAIDLEKLKLEKPLAVALDNYTVELTAQQGHEDQR